MEHKFIPESNFTAETEGLIGINDIVYFKLVYLKRSALDKLNNNAEAVKDKIKSIDGHYLISKHSKDLRAAMHAFVDRMFDAVEKQS